MKLVFIVVVLTVLLLTALLFLSIASRNKKPLLGLVNNQLQPCLNASCCVCSEALIGNAISTLVVPFDFGEAPAVEAWRTLTDSILALNGSIITHHSDYLWAVFHSRFFGFADDFEARLDIEKRQIHIRSASRVGRSDFGANRRRVLRMHRAFLNRLQYR